MGLHRQARHARSSAVAYVRQAVGSLPVVWRLPRACTKPRFALHPLWRRAGQVWAAKTVRPAAGEGLQRVVEGEARNGFAPIAGGRGSGEG